MLTERQIAYHLYLKSDHWKCLRAKAIEVWGCRCNACESIANIEVHHLNYHNLLDVTTEDLMPLCAKCHKDIHDSKLMTEYLKSNAPSAEKRARTIAYLYGVIETKISAGNAQAIKRPSRPRSERKLTRREKKNIHYATRNRENIIFFLKQQGYSTDNLKDKSSIDLWRLSLRYRGNGKHKKRR